MNLFAALWGPSPLALESQTFVFLVLAFLTSSLIYRLLWSWLSSQRDDNELKELRAIRSQLEALVRVQQAEHNSQQLQRIQQAQQRNQQS
jgi:hypothetical protein